MNACRTTAAPLHRKPSGGLQRRSGGPGTRAAVLAALLTPAIALAQWSPSATMDLGMNYGRMALSQSTLSGTRALAQTGKETIRKASSPSADADADSSDSSQRKPAPVDATRFESSAQVSAMVDRRFVDVVAGDDPQRRAAVADKVAAGDYQQQFEQRMERLGFSDHDLADVAAAHYVALWEVIQGEKLSAGQARAVRDQMRASMRREPRITGLPDRQKQEIAETFILHTAAAVDAYRELKRRGDPAQLARFRQGIQRNLLPEGPDMSEVKVTAAGFVSLD